MATATWVREELEGRAIDFQELHHADTFTAQGLAQEEHVSGHLVAKVVCVLVDGQPFELILPASRRVNLHQVRELLGASSVRLADEDELERWFTDCEVGAIPALRHWRDVEVLMDQHLYTDGSIVLQGGTHRDAIRMRFDDWFAMVDPRVESFSEPITPDQRQAIFGIGHRPFRKISPPSESIAGISSTETPATSLDSVARVVPNVESVLVTIALALGAVFVTIALIPTVTVAVALLLVPLLPVILWAMLLFATIPVKQVAQRAQQAAPCAK